MTPAVRKSCGMFLGLKLHVAAGEQPCSECLRAEDLRRLEHEGISWRLPPPPDVFAPVTPGQAAANRALLEDALRAAARESRRTA